MKNCKKCDINQDFVFFHKNSSSDDGYRDICKECRKSESRIRYENNKTYFIEYRENKKDKIREHNKNFRDNNVEKIKEYRKKYYQDNKVIIIEKIKEYVTNNIEKVKERKKKYRNLNKEKISENKKIYYIKNRDVINEKNKLYNEKNCDKLREYYQIYRNTEEYKKYRSDYIKTHRKLKPHIYAWRTILNNTLRNLKLDKNGKTNELLGYSAIELKENIENKFIDGMSWNNWGKWHIDHIRPISSFDENETPNIVNSLNNLQPLWAKDNLKKSNKRIK